MLIVEALEENGYRVLQAADGPSGLEVLRSSNHVDLLITDVGLPGGMNGRQVADAARVYRSDLSVLFVTGYAESTVIGDGQLDAGMLVLTKPFTDEDLMAKVRELVSGRVN
jgi:CheY-like chemotaxis protein